MSLTRESAPGRGRIARAQASLGLSSAFDTAEVLAVIAQEPAVAAGVARARRVYELSRRRRELEAQTCRAFRAEASRELDRVLAELEAEPR